MKKTQRGFVHRFMISGLYLGMSLLGSQAMGASYQMDFWTLSQTQNAVDTTIAGQPLTNIQKITEPPLVTGTFSIADHALGTPHAFIPLNSSDFLFFSATFGGNTFELPDDVLITDFLGYPLNRQLGIRLDNEGQVQRFDIPLFSTSNSGYIYDDESSSFPNPSLTLWDRDPFGGESYFVQEGDGWLLLPAGTASTLGLVDIPLNQQTVILPAGVPLLSGLVHDWRTNRVFGTATNGVFRITEMANPPGSAPIPEPSTFLLFGSGLGGVILWRIRRKRQL